MNNKSDELKNRLKSLVAVQAGWAFGVPEDGREMWLNHVVTEVQKPFIEDTAPGYDKNDIYSFQDDLLIAIQDGKPLPTKVLSRIPPMRAYLIACIAEKAGTGLQQGTAEQLLAEAIEVSGKGKLGEWWKR